MILRNDTAFLIKYRPAVLLVVYISLTDFFCMELVNVHTFTYLYGCEPAIRRIFLDYCFCLRAFYV